MREVITASPCWEFKNTPGGLNYNVNHVTYGQSSQRVCAWVRLSWRLDDYCVLPYVVGLEPFLVPII